MEKVDLAKQQIIEEEVKGKSTKLILIVGLVGVTAALVLLATIGGVYVNQLQTNCKSRTAPDYKEKYNVKDDTDENDNQEVDVDRKHHIEKLTTRTKDGQISSVVVFNYHTRIIAMHIPQDKKCYMIGGIREEIGSFDDSVAMITSEVKKGSKMNNITYTVEDKKPIYDTSFLTDDLLDDCSKGNLYWLERSNVNVDELEKTREKRAWRVCAYVRVRIGWWYYYVYRCWYIG